MTGSTLSTINPTAAYVHPTATVDPGAKLGAGTQVWHYTHIMSGARIGERCTLGQNTFVAGGVRIGAGTKIQNNVSLFAGLHVANDVFIGPSVVFTNVRLPRSAYPVRGAYADTYVEEGVSIGANATILCGVRLGAHCMVGAGAVVTKSVVPYRLVVGNPARPRGWVSRRGTVLTLEGTHAVCALSGERYELRDECLHLLPPHSSEA